MTRPSGGDSISQFHTFWGAVRQAHAHRGDAAPALASLVDHYGAAARRYFLRATRDPNAADDLYQDFALSLLNGGFRGADPGRGRFRDYLKAALHYLVFRHRRREGTRPGSPAADTPEPETREGPDAAMDRGWREAWREHLIDLAWAALARHDWRTRQRNTFILRFHIDHAGLPPRETAARLGVELGQAVRPDCARQWPCRARARFADLVLEELARAQEHADAGALGRELAALDLPRFCREALERRREREESALDG